MTESDHLRAQIQSNMQLKSTEELLEIWQENDHSEWSETAFDVIREILKSRLGEVPPRQADSADREGETYYDYQNVTKVAALADFAAWGVLAAYVVQWASGGYSAFQRQDFPVAYSLYYGLASGLGYAVQGFYMFVILKAVAQAIYILVDIEENTHGLSRYMKSRREDA